MRKILDKMFCNKKLSILLPIIVAMVTYILLILFGNSNNKLDTLLALPIISAFWFFGIANAPKLCYTMIRSQKGVQGYSSVGRAAVSKTACPGFES